MQPGAPERAPDTPIGPGAPDPALAHGIGVPEQGAGPTAQPGLTAHTDPTAQPGLTAHTDPTGHPPPPHDPSMAELRVRRPARRAGRSTHDEPGGVTGGAVVTPTDVRQMPLAPTDVRQPLALPDVRQPLALRTRTPNPDDPPHDPARHHPTRTEIPPRGLRLAIRARRERRPPPDPDAEPTMARMFGQFGLLGLSVLAIIVVLLLPCMIGFEIITRR